MTFKTYDEMDASHRLAYKMGREDAVANPNIEAAQELAWIEWRLHPRAVVAIIAADHTPPGDDG